MPALRQLKKDRTRRTLVDVSRKLFRKQGFEATTLEQIAAAAEVSVPTLLTYFESKERLALAQEYDGLAAFRADIEDPARERSTLELWRGRVSGGAADVGSKPRDYLRYNRFLASSPVLVRGLLVLLQQYEDVLASGLARDRGGEDLTTRLMATTLSFGNQAAVRRWIAGGGRDDLAQACVSVIDFVRERFA